MNGYNPRDLVLTAKSLVAVSFSTLSSVSLPLLSVPLSGPYFHVGGGAFTLVVDSCGDSGGNENDLGERGELSPSSGWTSL